MAVSWKMPPIPKLGVLPRPVSPKRPPVRPTGPRLFKLGSQPGRLGGPGEPPPGFVSGELHNSRDEWTALYWPMAKVLGNPPDPRLPPYTGGTNWDYQVPLDGGRDQRGGQVCDAVFIGAAGDVCIRLQTPHWHINAPASVQAKDLLLKAKSSRYIRVADVFSQDVVKDLTGAAACRQIARALGGQDNPSPLYLGTSERTAK